MKKVLIILSIFLSSCASVRINKYVNSIHTLPVKQDQTIISQPSPPTQQTIDGIHYTCTSTDNTRTSTLDAIVAFSSQSGILYPGALIKGKSLDGGRLDPISVRRSGGTLTVSFFNPQSNVNRLNVGLTRNQKTKNAIATSIITKHVDEASDSKIGVAQRELTNQVPAGAQVARISFEKTEFHSFEQSFLSTGMSVSWLTGEFKAKLENLSTNKVSKYFVKVLQPFYDVSYESDFKESLTPSSFVSKDVHLKAFKNALGDPTGNPPAYVQSVSYGRILLMYIESSESQEELNSTMSVAFSGAFVDGSANLTTRQKEVLTKSTINVIALGGNAAAAFKIIAQGSADDMLKELKKYLVDGANYDPINNPAYPISYLTRYIKNNETAKLSYTTNFQVNNCVKNPTKVTQILFDINLTTDDKDEQEAVEFWTLKAGVVKGNQTFGQGTKWGDPGTYTCTLNVSDITVEELSAVSVRMLKTAGCGGPRGCGMEGYINAWYLTEYGEKVLWFQIPNRQYGDASDNDVWLKQ
jgi:hypothetical protein